MAQENGNGKLPDNPDQDLLKEVITSSDSELIADIKEVEGIEDGDLKRSKNLGKSKLDKNWIKIRVGFHWLFFLFIAVLAVEAAYYLCHLITVFMKNTLSTPELAKEFLLKIWDVFLIVLATLFIEQATQKKD